MSIILNNVVVKAKQNLENLIKLQNKKVKHYFIKQHNQNDDNTFEKLLILAADIHGLKEQIDVVNLLASLPNTERITFIYDSTDLDISANHLTGLCKNKDLLYFSKRYNAISKLGAYPIVYDYFLKQSEYFIENICSLISKRQEPNYCLEELIKLKSLAIKHLCTLEYLVDAK